MTGLVINNIVVLLSELEYVTRIGGLVTPVKIEKNGKEYTIPVVRNDNITDCTPGEYVDFVPNDKETLMIYFEERGPANITNITANYHEIEHPVRLMCWLNSKLFGEKTYKAKYQIMQTVPDMMQAITPIVAIRIELDSQVQKEPQLFEKYGYDKKQYLIYPFDYFALDYTIKYRMALSCEIELTRNPESC